MGKLFDSKAVETRNLMCGNCDAEIYICDDCHDYFKPDDIVKCNEEKSKHYHLGCNEEVKVNNPSKNVEGRE